MQTNKREWDGFKKNNLDLHIEKKLEDHCSKYKIDALDALKLFPILSRRQNLKRFLIHNELFKKTIEVPGDIAELGVFRGLGLMTWANLLEIHCTGDHIKKVFGFDNWQGFNKFAEQDGGEVKEVQKFVGGFSPAKYFEELKDAINIFDEDRYTQDVSRIELVEGNIEETIVKFANERPGVRFSLVHFDCDMYAPTIAALKVLYPLITRGGLMVFDEYGLHNWPGETKAVEDFFADKPDVIIKKFPYSNVPGGYAIKK